MSSTQPSTTNPADQSATNSANLAATNSTNRSAGRPSLPIGSVDRRTMLEQATLVFKREFLLRIRSGLYLGMLGFSLFIILALSVVSIIVDSETTDIGLVGAQPPTAQEDLEAIYEELDLGELVFKTFDDRAALEEAVLDGSVELGVVDGREMVVESKNGSLPGRVSLIWQQANVEHVLSDDSLYGASDDPDKAALIAAGSDLALTELEPDPDSEAKTIIGIALVMLLFFSINGMAGLLSTSILEEKSNNIVELLLSSMSARSLLLGKVAAALLLGLLQVALLAGTGVLITNLGNLGTLPPIPASLLVVALGWFVLGFVFFGMLIAAAASLAPTQEDAQAVMLPVIILVMAGYFGSVLVASNPSALVSRIVSFVPIIAPFVMPARFISGDLTWWEHSLAAAISILAVVVVLQLGVRIYTSSVIHTDRKLGWLEAFRAETVR